MIRSLGVARVMSEKTMQMRSSGRTVSRNGGAAIGFSSAAMNAARSSGRPG